MLLMSFLLIGAGLLYINASSAVFQTFIVAFITSSIIVLASFKSYKNMVIKRLEADAIPANIDDQDAIDKIDDPYNLYDEDNIDENLSLKEIIKEEKKLLKKSRVGIKESVKNSAMSLSFLRVGAYLLFVLGFFYLLHSKNLSIICYLATIAIPSVIVIVYLLNFNHIKSERL